MGILSRREFAGVLAGVGAAAGSILRAASAGDMRLGLVTYQWAEGMDLPALLTACEKSGLLGVELRTMHAHGVEPALTKEQRKEVRKRFADSPVDLVGYGSNCEYHSPDPAELKQNIEQTKQYVLLMQDCGGSGVKVKPNTFPKGVPREKTIAQIGKALNEVGAFGADHGQKIRLEVHGRETCELPVIKAIMDIATHPNVYVCWNSNGEDLAGAGLDANFNMVKARIGDTTHVRELNDGDYPYERLFKLFEGIHYKGWFLLEARTEQPDKVKAMAEQLAIFKKMIHG
ncbi:MAG: TIM barrel protein [Bryobacteraceae bacterium]